MARRAGRNGRSFDDYGAPLVGAVECDRLEPIRVVERELTRPDGSVLRVEVPVYPPFRQKKRPREDAVEAESS